MDIQKYLAERRSRFPTAAKLSEAAALSNLLKENGVLLNQPTSTEAITIYEQFTKQKQTKIRKQKPKLLNYLLRNSQHEHNSLVLEALTFISKQEFLQNGIPEEFRFNYQVSKDVTVVNKEYFKEEEFEEKQEEEEIDIV
ncbi:Conserved_hypothetical protein [Hexamita inflata]|uniref:Uncharacterized protein n=1 Tax=Hexamita inflata TaxID=28002 RepID=A0AA86NQK9_9EUKA|nr:Conserved hypothetical protein [Hexamita inflata]